MEDKNGSPIASILLIIAIIIALIGVLVFVFYIFLPWFAQVLGL